MTKKDIDFVIHDILGYDKYPDGSWKDLPEGWSDFKEKYFFRSGKIDEVAYTSEQNRHISGTAMLQTLDEIKKRLENIKGV